MGERTEYEQATSCDPHGRVAFAGRLMPVQKALRWACNDRNIPTEHKLLMESAAGWIDFLESCRCADAGQIQALRRALGYSKEVPRG